MTTKQEKLNFQAAPGWSAAEACLAHQGKLSVIMPAFNLETRIASNIEHVRAFLALSGIPFEIVPVDDGSSDKTAMMLQTVAEAHSAVIRPVLIERNNGKGNALRQGLAASTGTHILLLDGDLDLDPVMLPTFFDIMLESGADIVIGSKRHPKSLIDYPWRRRLASATYYGIVKLLIGLPVSDTQTGMKLFRREALQWSFDRMLVKQFAFDLELLAIAYARGYRIAEAPIRMSFGDKKGCLTWQNTRQVMVDTLAVFYRLRLLRYYDSVEPAEMPEPPPLVSVVIACPAPSNYLAECLEGLKHQTYRNFEVLVLPDEPAAIADQGFPLRILPTGRIRPAEKRNLGIAAAQGEIVAFLDDDAAPLPVWLERAVKYFSKPEIGGVGGPGITPDNDPWMAQVGGRVYANPLVSGNYRFRYHPDRVRDVDDIPSCNLLVRTALLRELNGFRTDYWPGEDTILCAEIVHKLKKRLVYDPWATVTHHRRALFAPHLRQIGRYALHRGNFARRFPSTSRRIGYMLPSVFVLGVVIGAAVAWLHPLLTGMYVAAVAAYLVITFLFALHSNPAVWIVTWLGIMATHLVYGFRFLQGLFTTRLPCEVQRFDHPAEKASR